MKATAPTHARPNELAPSEGLEVTLLLSGEQVEAIAQRVAQLIAPAPAHARVWVGAARATACTNAFAEVLA